MANEAQINSSMRIRKVSGNITLIDYNPRPTAFLSTVNGTIGPVPGAFLVTDEGVNVDFSALTTPGLCRVMNQSATETVEYGAWDQETGRFLPTNILLPGEFFPMRLSPNLGGAYGGGGVTGTGTLDTSVVSLRFRSLGADCHVLVEAFES